jgi:hypothetical protein
VQQIVNHYARRDTGDDHVIGSDREDACKALVDIVKLTHAVPEGEGARLFLDARHIDVPHSRSELENILAGRERTDTGEDSRAGGPGSWRSVSRHLRRRLKKRAAEATRNVFRRGCRKRRDHRTQAPWTAKPTGFFTLHFCNLWIGVEAVPSVIDATIWDNCK